MESETASAMMDLKCAASTQSLPAVEKAVSAPELDMQFRKTTIREFIKPGTVKHKVALAMSKHFRERKTTKEWSEVTNEGSIGCRISEIAILLKNSSYMVYKTENDYPAFYWMDDNTGPTNVRPYGPPPSKKHSNDSDGEEFTPNKKLAIDDKEKKKWMVDDAFTHIKKYISVLEKRETEITQLAKKRETEREKREKELTQVTKDLTDRGTKLAAEASAHSKSLTDQYNDMQEKLLAQYNKKVASFNQKLVGLTETIKSKDECINELNKVIVEKDETIGELEKQVKLAEEAKQQVGVNGFLHHLKEFVVNCEAIISSPEGKPPQSV